MKRPKRWIITTAIGGLCIVCFVVIYYMMQSSIVDELVDSTQYSIIAADDIEVRLNTPPSSGLVTRLTTLVLTKPRVLCSASPVPVHEVLAKGKHIVAFRGPFLAEQAALAIRQQQDDDELMQTRGLVKHGEGVSYILQNTFVDIYDIGKNNELHNHRRVLITHLLIKL